MAPEKTPEWLPGEWIVGFSLRKNGSRDQYYISPVERQVFRSRVKVESYLKTKEGADELMSARSLTVLDVKKETKKKKVIVSGRREWDESWLPKDWIVEVQIRKTGRKCKCYLDPSSWSRFYTKSEVLRHLEKQKQSSPATPKKFFRMQLPDYLVSHFLYSPDGLPEGWIKETKYEKTTLNKSGLKKHVCYTDPEDRYVFRTLKDAFHYVETAEATTATAVNEGFHYVETAEATTTAISKGKGQSGSNSFLEKESHPPIFAKQPESVGDGVRRRLFSGCLPKPSGENRREGDEYLGEQQESPPILCILTDGEDDANITCSNRPNPRQAKMKVDRVAGKVSEPRKRKPTVSIKYMEKKAKKEKMKIIEPQTMELVVEEEPKAAKLMSVELEDRKNQEKIASKAAWEHPAKCHEMEEKLLEEDECTLSVPEDKLCHASRMLVQDDIIESERKFLVPEEEQSLASVWELDELAVEHVTSKVCEPVSSSCQDSRQVDAIELCAEDKPNPENIGSISFLEHPENLHEIERVVKEDKKGLSIQEDKVLESENKMTVEEDTIEAESKFMIPEEQQPQAAVTDSGKLAAELVIGIESVVPCTGTDNKPCEAMSELTRECGDTAANVLVSCDPSAVLSVTGENCFEKPETDGILGKQESSREELDDLKPDVEFSDSALDLPFWPDPCIEFAFKTLTGDIPILDGAFFQEENDPLESSSASGLILSARDDLVSLDGGPSRPKQFEQRDSSSAEERHCGLQDGSNKSLERVDEKHEGMHA